MAMVHWPTLSTLRISKLFISTPRKKRYCCEITKELKMPENTVRDQLKEMAYRSWLESEKEKPNPVTQRADGRKIFYRMTNYGIESSIAALKLVQFEGTIIASS